MIGEESEIYTFMIIGKTFYIIELEPYWYYDFYEIRAFYNNTDNIQMAIEFFLRATLMFNEKKNRPDYFRLLLSPIVIQFSLNSLHILSD